MKTLSTVFKALSDEARIRILNLLMYSGELCVCDIQAVMGFTQTKVSRHLGYLKKAGLVSDRKQGLWMLYSIAKAKDEDHRQILESLAALLKSNEVARLDAKRLASNMASGCCATTTVLKVEPLPAKLQFEKF